MWKSQDGSGWSSNAYTVSYELNDEYDLSYAYARINPEPYIEKIIIKISVVSMI